jgi:hypothetical protein
VCFDLLPNASPCEVSEQCQSAVCDAFDLICCNRDCDDDDEICFPGEGVCRSLTYTPAAATPTPTGTPGPTPAENGDACAEGANCASGNCVNNICCEVPACEEGQHCAGGSGICVDGEPPSSPTPTEPPTPLPTANPCGACPPGFRCVGEICVRTSDSGGGCSTAGDNPSHGNLILAALVPLALWTGRRWQLQRSHVRRRGMRR